MTHNEAIALIQAHRDGKGLQWKTNNSDEWDDVKDLDLLIRCLYLDVSIRIKPEPKYWVPAIGEKFYIIDAHGRVSYGIRNELTAPVHYRYTYRTHEQAQIVADKIKAIHKEHREIV